MYRLRALLRLTRWLLWGFRWNSVVVQRELDTLRHGTWQKGRSL